jgi:hypothetical protein
MPIHQFWQLGKDTSLGLFFSWFILALFVCLLGFTKNDQPLHYHSKHFLSVVEKKRLELIIPNYKVLLL